jgi:hypothetical protein
MVIDEYDRYIFDHVIPLLNMYFKIRLVYKNTNLLLEIVKLFGKLLLYCPDEEKFMNVKVLVDSYKNNNIIDEIIPKISSLYRAAEITERKLK